VNAFQPQRADGRSLRRVAFDYLAGQIERGTLRAGQVVQHDVLAREMGVAFPTSTYYQTMVGVTKLLQQRFSLSLVSVRGTGYQLVQGMAMVDKGRGEHRRGRNQMSKAVATVNAVDEGVLETAEQRTVLVQVRRGMQIIAAVIDQQAEQIAKHDEEIELLKESRVSDQTRIAAVEEQIRRMAEKLPATGTG
jgi:hypothetical protein